MEKASINDLALATEKEFVFLETLGIQLAEWSEIFPESRNPGFKLTFQNPTGMKITITYSNEELRIRAGSKLLFGGLKDASSAP